MLILRNRMTGGKIRLKVWTTWLAHWRRGTSGIGCRCHREGNETKRLLVAKRCSKLATVQLDPIASSPPRLFSLLSTPSLRSHRRDRAWKSGIQILPLLHPRRSSRRKICWSACWKERVIESATSPYGTIFHANPGGRAELQNYSSKFRPRERSIFERSTAPPVVGSHMLGQWMLGILFPLLPSMRTQTEREVLGVWRLGELALLIRQTEQVASFSPNSLLSRSSPRFGRNIQRLHLFDQC